jgi:hypothetical protein
MAELFEFAKPVIVGKRCYGQDGPAIHADMAVTVDMLAVSEERELALSLHEHYVVNALNRKVRNTDARRAELSSRRSVQDSSIEVDNQRPAVLALSPRAPRRPGTRPAFRTGASESCSVSRRRADWSTPLITTTETSQRLRWFAPPLPGARRAINERAPPPAAAKGA